MDDEIREGQLVLEDFRRYAASVLGYPADFTEPLTAHEIAELGAGLVSFPPGKRPRASTICVAPVPTEQAEDEAAILERTPMRGVLHRPRTAAEPPPLPLPPVPEESGVHPAEILAAKMPPIGWEFGPIAVVEAAPKPKKPRLSITLPPDDGQYYVSPLEQQSPEYRAWAARMSATVTKEYSIGGVLHEVETPVVEVSELFPVQNVGSARIFTSQIRAEAALNASVREEIRLTGLQTSHLRALGSAGRTKARTRPEWHIGNLGRFPLPVGLNPAGEGRYALFLHSELTPPRRCLPDDPTVFTGFLPATTPSNEDKAVLNQCREVLPVEFPVARVSTDNEHPGLAPVRGFELYADSPAGRSLTAVNAATDFLVTASGRIVGEIDCTVTLGQTVPKTENLNDGELRRAAEMAYHNAILPIFFPRPRAPPVPAKLSALLVPWTPLKSLLPRSRCIAIIEAIAARDATKRYLPKAYMGPPRPKVLSRRQQMELQAVADHASAQQTVPYLRPSDPRQYASAVHTYLKGNCYLQVGGKAASSPIGISPLTLPVKAPVAEAVKLGDAVPRKRDGNGVHLPRFPKRMTKKEEAEDRLQGTRNDQRTFDRAKRIELSKKALDSGLLDKKDTHTVRVALVKLEANRPQSNEERWTLIKIISPRPKVNQGTVREDGLRHALHRSQWYTAAVFRALTRGHDGTDVVYLQDCRDVRPGHRIEFCEWTSDPAHIRHVRLHIRWPGKPLLVLRSQSAEGWTCALTPEERVVAIWAVYYRLSIRVKRRVRAELQAHYFQRDVSGSVKMVDEQIEELRRKLCGLSGLTSAFLQSLCR